MARPRSPENDSPCPVCGDDGCQAKWRIGDRLFSTTEKRFVIRRCLACGTDFQDPMPTAEELSGYYPQGYWVGPAPTGGVSLHARALEAYRRLALRDHVAFTRRVARQQRRRGLDPRVIDVGCGDGSFLAALGEDGCTGMDVSEPALRAIQLRGFRAVRGSVSAYRKPTAPFADRSFTLITSFHFLEHVPDPRPVLSELRRILHPDGDLVIQVPNKDSLQARLLGRRWAGLDVPRHLVNYSAQTVCRVLEESGLRVVRESHFSVRDNPTTLANSLVPAFYPPARGARGQRTAGWGAWCASTLYLAVTLTALPLTLLESALGRGAAVMVQARPA